MKESPRSRLLRYLNSSDKVHDDVDITVLFNMYKMGLWETYFYYVPQAYILTKKAIDNTNDDQGAIGCWGLYFGVK